MSDERLDALGLPRREFLKRAAIGAFAVPAIVSFGLSGTAEAAPGCVPNQTISNQITYGSQLNDLAIYIYYREQQGNFESPGLAKYLRQKVLDAEGKLLDGDLQGFCKAVSDFLWKVRTSSARIEGSTASYLDSNVSFVGGRLGCNCN